MDVSYLRSTLRRSKQRVGEYAKHRAIGNNELRRASAKEEGQKINACRERPRNWYPSSYLYRRSGELYCLGFESNGAARQTVGNLRVLRCVDFGDRREPGWDPGTVTVDKSSEAS